MTNHEDIPGEKPQPESTSSLLRILALVAASAISVLIFINRAQIAQFAHLGYPGIFLIALLGSATVLMPMPGLLFTTLMGTVFNPFIVAIVSGLGAGIGELSGYLAGYSGQGVLEKSKYAPTLMELTRKYGMPGIALMAMIPNPAFDVVGITAGVMKMPLLKFLIAAIIGNIIKMMVFAYGGTTIVQWLGLTY